MFFQRNYKKKAIILNPIFFKKTCVKGQSTIESLIILSVALTILIIFLGLVFNQVELQNNIEQQKLGVIALKTLASEINDAYFLGPGTVKTVVINIPQSVNYRRSFIYQNNLVLNVGGTDFSENVIPIVKGNWPESSGSYSFKIVVFRDFVSLNNNLLKFDPEKIQEKISQGSLKDLNLSLTNLTNSVKTYSITINSPSDTKVTINQTSEFEVSSVTLNPNQSKNISLTLSCSQDSSGTHIGEIGFISDISFSFPIIINCESSQQKLSIYPGKKDLFFSTNLINNEKFILCNNSSNDLIVNTTIIGELRNVAVSPKNILVLKNSCTDLDLNLFSTTVGNYVGQIRVSSSGVSTISDVNLNFFQKEFKYFFKSVENNLLNTNYHFSKNINQRLFDNAWVASGEIDWNKDKNYVINGNGWDQNLVAYYKFNDRNTTHIFDSVRGNDGNLLNGVDLNSNGLWDSNAIDFDGVSKAVSLNHAGFTNLSSATVTGWFMKRDNLRGHIFSLASTINSFNEFGIDIKDTNKLGVAIKNNNNYPLRFDVDSPKINTDQWYHFAFLCGLNGNKIYINGELVNDGNITYTNGNSTVTDCMDSPLNIDSARIGSRDIGDSTGPGVLYDTYFNGLIDEVTIWDKNLSDLEILELYNSNINAKFVDKNIFDAGEIVDWNAIKINSDFNYDFGENRGVSSVDLNIYSCEDIFCDQKSSFNYLIDLNSESFVPISINNSRYIGFDVYFKLIENYSIYGNYIYAGSFLKDINLEYK